jgi:Ulp1 family protease
MHFENVLEKENGECGRYVCMIIELFLSELPEDFDVNSVIVCILFLIIIFRIFLMALVIGKKN